MSADLTAIRALLASVEGFTPGPWRRDGLDVVPARLPSEGWQIADCGTSNSPDGAPYNASLIAAAPTLHAHLTEAADEVERLRWTMSDLANVIASEQANALREIATVIGYPTNADPLTNLDGLVMMVQRLAHIAESRDLAAIIAEERADAVAADRLLRDRRIEPVEHARAVLAAFKDGEDDVKAAYAMEQANGWEMTRATLLARVGPEVLAEVER